ncbi:MAG: DotU family type IV/VI secretion system protein [Chloroflexi bacterium]|nr:DotU family type IV/VI secretion system protein [Chloroflexota bacterium]
MSNVVFAPRSPAATQRGDYTRAGTQSATRELVTSNGGINQPGPRLAEICRPMLSLILSLRDPERLDDVAALHTQFQAEYSALYHQAALAGIDQGDVELAAFALVAFADETIAESAWIDRAQWPSLQYDYFTTRRAGEQFFEQLQQIQGNKYDYTIWKDAARSQVLEVYYLCLLLGFRGAWAFDPPPRVQHELEQIQRHARSRPLTPIAPNGGPRSYRHLLHGTVLGWIWLALAIQAVLIGGLLWIHLQ